MMGLVGNEICQEMSDIKCEIAPHISRCRGNPSSFGAAKAEEIVDGKGTLVECPDKICLLDMPPVY